MPKENWHSVHWGKSRKPLGSFLAVELVSGGEFAGWAAVPADGCRGPWACRAPALGSPAGLQLIWEELRVREGSRAFPPLLLAVASLKRRNKHVEFALPSLESQDMTWKMIPILVIKI